MYTLPVEDLSLVSMRVSAFWPSESTILITGGTGFFGRWMVEAIHFIDKKLNTKNKYIILSRQNPADLVTKIPILADPIFILKQVDLNQEFSVAEDYQYVIHAASDVAAIKNNLSNDYGPIFQMTENIVKSIGQRTLKKFLYVSSGGVYHPGTRPAQEDDLRLEPEIKMDSYAAAKRQSELLVSKLSHACIARCFSFVGPYVDSQMASMDMLNKKASGQKIVLKSPQTVRSFMYPTDLVEGLFKLLFLPNKHQIYNLGSDQECSLMKLAQTIAQLAPVSELEIVASMASTGASNISLAGHYYCANMNRFTAEYGTVLAVNLDSALQKTFNFINQERSKS